MPDIGIVTISFNQGAFLGRAMESVLATDVDVEYVVVDAGSTDGSRALISSKKAQLTTAIFEPDRGPADGLNKGMARLSSPIVGYLNADDYYLPGALHEVVDYFERHPGVDIALGHGIIVDSTDQLVRHLRATSYTPQRYALGACMVVQQATFFRREAFERAGGFNDANGSCWDAELVMDMVLAGARVKKVDRYWGAFRLHSDSISVSGRLEGEYVLDSARLASKGLGREPRRRDRSAIRLGRLGKWICHPDTLAVAVYDRLTNRC